MYHYRSREDLEEDDEPAGSISIPWVVLASVLIGGGLFSLAYWLLNFSDWKWFGGVVPVVLGFLMLLNRRAGTDRSEAYRR